MLRRSAESAFTNGGGLRFRRRKGFAGLAAAVVIALPVAMLGLAGCGASAAKQTQTSQGVSTSPVLSHYPVTVHDCNGPEMYDKAPNRIVSLDGVATDLLISMGLTDKIVGVVKSENPSGEWPQDAGIVAKLPSLGYGSGYPSLDSVLALRPDMIVSSYDSAFAQSAGSGAPQHLKSLGIGSYELNSKCGSKPTTTRHNDFDPRFIDIYNLGRVFNMQIKAASLIDRLQAGLAH
jgi:iron complex transport system substrate-binding protein